MLFRSQPSKLNKVEAEAAKLTPDDDQASTQSSSPSSQDSGFSEVTTTSRPDEESDEDVMPAPTSQLCTLCCAQPKNACLIHGRISHQVCCYGCAKKLYKSRSVCPVCRRRIEKITKNIVA